MPRSANRSAEAVIDALTENGTTKVIYTFPIHPVKDYLKCKYFKYAINDPEMNPKKEGLECPVCYEIIDCKNCFTLLTCSHYLHRHCWDKIINNKCPLCNSH